MPTPHPLREVLHNEVHARPYERLSAPLALSHLALLTPPGETRSREHLHTLLRSRHLPLPAADAGHLSIDLGGVHLRWEQHTEFQTYTFWRQLPENPASFEPSAVASVPQDWLRGVPGQWLVGMHVMVTSSREDGSDPLVRGSLDEDSLVASVVMDGQAEVYTDFRLHGDGFARVVLVAASMHPRRLGRAVQRLLEIETYRMTALLGLPAAREVSATLADAERDLARIASEIRSAERDREPELLRQLTQLAGRVESLYASTHARFSASAAYFELVQRRIDELHEHRLAGLQTIGEFMDRRLGPAMQTCAWAGRRQQQLSERISRTSNLLRTRVEIEQQQSSQDLLDAMNRRQLVQLRLQSAVEGLSVAAITYYGAGLVGHLAKGGKEAGLLPLSPEVLVALAVPLIALGVWSGLRRMHQLVWRAAQ
ncbi:DUF3422 domain-containing protein [Aquabacterium sp. A7-Y]|uniref:DUF3422 family protein n=1 Tax=Aquabacterium sp. A7-Y TaxID=1349605 RepID=UPI00223D57D3|nr:DUF3422 domain-containing protein [Aquabacterium sp. A7-Y]MCW7536400.1 DUF3422 domain-containing protein [Aquabacterium sp. A7-Y]